MDFFANLFEDMPESADEMEEIFSSLKEGGMKDFGLSKKAPQTAKEEAPLSILDFLKSADSDIAQTYVPYSAQTRPATRTQAQGSANAAELQALWMQRMSSYLGK